MVLRFLVGITATGPDSSSSANPLPAGWEPVSGSAAARFADELSRETASGHVLHRRACNAIARRVDRDDVLFQAVGAPARYYVVHLTFRPERSPEWPEATPFRDLDDFRANGGAEGNS